MEWIFREQTEDARCRRELLGALIGLARATDGNEYMLSNSTRDVTVTALMTLEDRKADPALLIPQVREEKRKLVPDCFLCASPCGRTQDSDVNRILLEAEDIQKLKGEILAAICALASGVGEGVLYRALFSLGCDDWEAEDYHSVLQELESVNP